MTSLPAALARLGQETRAHHPAADRAWLSLALDGATVDAYRAQLTRVYGFEAPLERAFRETPALRGVLDPTHRARSHLLARDLVGLGVAPVDLARIPTRFDPIPFLSAEEALGWMYVVERSTLVHDIVRRSVAAMTGACAYLSAGPVASRWFELGRAVERVATTARAFAKIVDAAVVTLHDHCEWYAPTVHRPRTATPPHALHRAAP